MLFEKYSITFTPCTYRHPNLPSYGLRVMCDDLDNRANTVPDFIMG